MIVTAIPIVGFIVMLVWAFGNTNVNRKNYARAALILILISTVISFLFFGSFAS